MTSTTTFKTPGMRAGKLGAIALSGALLGLLGGAVARAETSGTATVPSDSTTPTTVAPAPTDVVSPDAAAPVVAAPVATTFTLPLFPVGLTVDITTGPGGALTSVMLNPADGFTAVAVRPNKVAFVNEDGTAKVVVKSNNGGQRVEARAGSLTEILGPGSWSGEMFPGVPARVMFEIVDDGGAPGIVVDDDVTGPNPEIGEVETRNRADGEDGDGDDEQEAKVRIRFSQDGQSRWLTIKAEVESDDDDSDSDGSTEAKVVISLSRIKASFTGVDALGPQTWNGVLCDGGPAMIEFTVADDGTLKIDKVTPEPERQKVEGNGVEVRFPDGEKVRIRVRNADGSLAVRVDEKIRCTGAQDPSLNVAVSTDDEEDDDATHSNDRKGDDRRGKGGNDGDDDDDDGDDDGDVTTVPTETTTPSTGDTVADESGSDD